MTDSDLVASLRERTQSNQDLNGQSWTIEAPTGFEGLRCTRFEFSSRGDRVPGQLFLPDGGSGPVPLILLQHGAGGDMNAPYIQAARPWIDGGAAVATIDFPLHGMRRSPKLSERLLSGIAGGVRATQEGDDNARRLWRGFSQQAVADLRGALDLLLARPEIDGSACAYAAFSLGSMIGSLFCAVDERPRAAALALAGGGFGSPDLDPARFISALAPRPLLMVNATQDQLVSTQAAEALFDAAKEPRSIEWYETGHDALPGVALKQMWLHLKSALSL